MPRKTKIAFTSCVRYEAFPWQPQWDDISAEDPDYLFLLGDQIYMDYGIWPFSREWNSRPKGYDAGMFRCIMDEKYKRQWNESHFKPLFLRMREKNAVFGTWDDHDFSWNNAKGAEPRKYRETKTIARTLFNKWVYGQEEDREVYRFVDTPHARAIFLDVRYYAQRPGSKSQLLGDRQWEFFENALNHKKKYTLICSGITMTQGKERWEQYTREYDKLCILLKKKGGVSGKGVLFVAGDIHKNWFGRPNGKRPCFEVVSSGLAINYVGVGLPFDDRHNWGLIELDETEVAIKLVNKKGATKYSINYDTWQDRFDS